MFEQFPYTNFHDLNLDWIIKKIKECYSPDNPPEFAVISVNGETGEVVLYKNAVVQLPAVDETTWNVFRKSDNTETGIQFIKNQPAQRINGINRYNIYDQGNPPPYPVTSVDGSTGAVSTWANSGNDTLTLPVGSEGDSWALRREVPSGYLGIEFELDDSDDPCGYFILKPEGAALQRIKILTPNDIPSSAGVVSINGEAGVVVLTGSDINVSTTDSRSIAEAIGDLVDDEYQMDNAITYTERGNTATQNIPLGKYVLWKNNPCISIASISNGDTLSSSNLLALDHGIVDNLLQTVNSQANAINTLNGKIENHTLTGLTVSNHVTSYVAIRTGNIVYVSLVANGYTNGDALIEGLPIPAVGIPVNAIGLSYETGVPTNVGLMIGASRTDIKVFMPSNAVTITATLTYVTNAS